MRGHGTPDQAAGWPVLSSQAMITSYSDGVIRAVPWHSANAFLS
jgi:hypothetical protein